MVEKEIYASVSVVGGSIDLDEILEWLDFESAWASRNGASVDVAEKLMERYGVLWLAAGSFVPMGDYIYRFYVPEGVDHPCQFLRAYHGGKEIAR